jgi:hypothetical protein
MADDSECSVRHGTPRWLQIRAISSQHRTINIDKINPTQPQPQLRQRKQMERRQGHRERRVDGSSTKDRTSERSRKDHHTSRSSTTEGKTNRQSSTGDDVFKTKLLRDHPTSRTIATEGRTSRQSSAGDDVFKTKLLRDHLPTIRDQGQSRPTKPASSIQEKSRNAPLNSQKPSSSKTSIPTGTIFKTEFDVKMASRQTRIESMPPNERKVQEQWAQSQLRQLDTKCPLGYDWGRIRGGYRCLPDGKPGIHMVTDELIAEGKGGVYMLSLDMTTKWKGPFYKDLSSGKMVMRDSSGKLKEMFQVIF